jgi:phosphoserine aminotransferase
MNEPMNFSGGPGASPASGLRQPRDAIEALPETGLSVLGMSHRSDRFRGVLDEAERNLRALLGIPAGSHVLFMQGGSSLQFSMLPMNFLRASRRHAEYIVSGYWSAKAPVEARLEGDTRVIWDGRADGFRQLPAADELKLSPEAAYLHYVSNSPTHLAYPMCRSSATCRPICWLRRSTSNATRWSTRTRRKTSGQPASRS